MGVSPEICCGFAVDPRFPDQHALRIHTRRGPNSEGLSSEMDHPPRIDEGFMNTASTSQLKGRGSLLQVFCLVT